MPYRERKSWTRDVDHVGRIRDRFAAEHVSTGRSARRFLILAIVFAAAVGAIAGTVVTLEIPIFGR